jgi:hypothetical protein
MRFIPLAGGLLSALLCLATTCERTVDLGLPTPSPRLVVISNFSPGQFVQVRVSKSQNVLEDLPEEYLSDASVTLYQGDEFIEVLELVIPLAERIPPYYTTRTFQPKASVTYTILVEAAGFPSVTAESFIPEPVPLDEFFVGNVSRNIGSEPELDRYSYDVFLHFSDPAEEVNYYHLNLYQEVLFYSNNEAGDTLIDDRILLPVTFSDLNNANYVEAYIGGGILLEDNPFGTGISLPLSFELNREMQLVGQLYAELRTVSREYYLFHASVSRQQDQSEGPFSEPVTIFNNIMNGHGVFAGFNVTQDSLNIRF